MDLSTTFEFRGTGTVAYNTVPDPNLPGMFKVTEATFTFTAPEPSIPSLLLLCFAGLAVLSRRRRAGAALLPTG